MIKLVGKSLRRNNIYIASKYLTHLLVTKRKAVILSWRSLANITLAKWSSLTSPLITYQYHVPLISWEGHITSVVLSKIYNLNPVIRKYQTLIDGHSTKPLTSVQKYQVIEHKERLKDWHRLAEMKIRQLNAFLDPGLGLGTEKGHEWKSWWYANKVVKSIGAMWIF